MGRERTIAGFGIENLTQREIVLSLGANEYVFDPSGIVPQVHIDRLNIGRLQLEEDLVPLNRTTASRTYGLPDQELNVFLIVPTTVARQNPKRGDLLIVDRIVRDGTGKVYGAGALATVADQEAFEAFIQESIAER